MSYSDSHRIQHGCCAFAAMWFAVAFTPTAWSADEPRKVEANYVVEVTLTTDKAYPDPFKGVTLDVVVVAPEGGQAKLPAFWAGGGRWCFRYASGRVGLHSYRTECSDAANPQLHGVTGKIEVVAYRGENPL